MVGRFVRLDRLGSLTAGAKIITVDTGKRLFVPGGDGFHSELKALGY